LYEKFEAEIEKLNQRVEEQACKRLGARLLMTHPGVGAITALATDVFLGDPARFADSKALASYVGMIPREYSSRKAVTPVRGCQKRRMVRTVIGRLIRLPASLEEEGVRITHHGRW